MKGMNRKHLKGALLITAASLLATGAYAQNPHAAPQGKANAADKDDKAADRKAEKAGDKGANAADKAGEKAADKADKADKADEKAGEKGKSVEERASRKAKQHDEQREKLKSMLKGPMDEALKQELRRHAERLARLERVKAVAQTEKDTGTVEKATTLIGKENERHDKWMNKHVTVAAAPGAAAATPGAPGAPGALGAPGATPTPAADTKGGAK